MKHKNNHKLKLLSLFEQKENMSNFTQLKGNCPICQGERKDCRQANDTLLVFCRTHYSADGWINKGTDKQGFAYYVESVDHLTDSEKEAKDKAFDRATEERKKKERLTQQRALTIEQRHKQHQKILSQLGLREDHKQDLLKRGLSEESIQTLGYRSTPRKGEYLYNLHDNLAGFAPTDVVGAKYRYVGRQGCFIPVYDWTGRCQGYQIKTDSPEDAKYVWLKSYYRDNVECTSALKNGEYPLSFRETGESNRSILNVCEGTLKPQIASEIHGGMWVGSALNGDLRKSEQLLKTYLEHYIPTIRYFPDAGCFLNENVRNRDLKQVYWFASLGYTVWVADWGQLADNSAGDIDEVPANAEINWLKPHQFKNKASEFEPKNWNDIIAKLKVSHNQPKLRSVKTFNHDAELVEYKLGCIPKAQKGVTLPKFIIRNNQQRKNFYKEAKQKGWKYVLDSSTMGSGKSHMVGELMPDDFFTIEQEEDNHKIFYMTQSSRNPTVVTIEENYVELPTRHNGFVETNKQTPLGNPQRRRAKKEEVSDTPSNCHWTHRFQTVAEKNLKVDLCGICPFQNDCKHGSSDGYGFKSEIKHALSYSRLRANPQGISPDFVGEHTVGIVDEYSQTLEPYKTIEIGANDWFNANYLLRELTNKEWKSDLNDKIADISSLIQRDRSRYGLSHKEIIETLGTPPEWLGDAIIELETLQSQDDEVFSFLRSGEEYDATIRKNWLIDFLKIWNKELDGAFSASDNQMQILLRNQHLLEVLDKFGYVVFQDATGSKKDLANKIDCEEDEILEVSFTNPTKENLDLVHVTGLGRANKERSTLCQSRINALVEAFQDQHGKENIGFIDWKAHAKSGWLHHFSDGRGSNAFEQKSAIASFGVPFPHLGSLSQEYTLWTGETVDLSNPSEDFQELVGERTAGEIIQEIGRIRANRRQDEQLTYYLCGDVDVQFLVDRGYKITQKNAMAITPDAGDAFQRTCYAINTAMKTFRDKVNFSAIGEAINKSRSLVSKTIRKLGGQRALQEFVENLIFGVDNIEPTEEEEWIINKYVPQELIIGETSWLEDLLTICEDKGISIFRIFATAKTTTKAIILVALLQYKDVPKKIKEMLFEWLDDIRLDGKLPEICHGWENNQKVYELAGCES